MNLDIQLILNYGVVELLNNKNIYKKINNKIIPNKNKPK